ncbi:MAG: molybdopterin-binding protein [Anaerolineales bacterium]|nr:MAG: molybdopterin-binding protein [Anaerolineales bacterium]
MIFGPLPLEAAEGKILGHNLAGPDGKRLLRKGRPLSKTDIENIRAATGRQTVYVALLEPDDLDENTAAQRIASAVMGANTRVIGPSAGRVNLQTTALGVVRVDIDRLNEINQFEGVTLATLANHTPVAPRKITATVKIIPFALPDKVVTAVETIARRHAPIVSVDSLSEKCVSVIFSGSPSIKDRLLKDFAPLFERIENLGSKIQQVDFIPLEDESGESALAEMLEQRIRENGDLIVLAGETAIMDRYDIAPRAVERAGGRVECVGVPVDPGNLLMLGYIGPVPVLGVPGCARSKKTNIVDWVLPRLLAGDRLARYDFIRLGHGGLLEDTRHRPMPRNTVI